MLFPLCLMYAWQKTAIIRLRVRAEHILNASWSNAELIPTVWKQFQMYEHNKTENYGGLCSANAAHNKTAMFSSKHGTHDIVQLCNYFCTDWPWRIDGNVKLDAVTMRPRALHGDIWARMFHACDTESHCWFLALIIHASLRPLSPAHMFQRVCSIWNAHRRSHRTAGRSPTAELCTCTATTHMHGMTATIVFRRCLACQYQSHVSRICVLCLHPVWLGMSFE